MRMKTSILLAAIAAPLLLTPGATAKDRPEYVLKLSVEKDEVTLGDTIDFKVSLEKKSGRSIDANALRLARNSVSLRVAFGESVRTISRIYGTVGRSATGKPVVNDDDAPKATLKRGKPLKLDLPVLAIRTGDLKFTAVYAGLPGLAGEPPTVESEPVDVKVKAPEGKTEIAAIMETSDGNMTITFNTDETYNTTLNFLTLAKEGRYDGLKFHRIIKGFMAQGGDPQGNGTGGPGYYIHREIAKDLKHERGVLSMARTSAPDSAGSQFFLMHAANAGLDGEYAAFGRVVEGLDVVDKICETPVGPTPRGERSNPLKPPIIKTIKVTTR